MGGYYPLHHIILHTYLNIYGNYGKLVLITNVRLVLITNAKLGYSGQWSVVRTDHRDWVKVGGVRYEVRS